MVGRCFKVERIVDKRVGPHAANLAAKAPSTTGVGPNPELKGETAYGNDQAGVVFQGS